MGVKRQNIKMLWHKEASDEIENPLIFNSGGKSLL